MFIIVVAIVIILFIANPYVGFVGAMLCAILAAAATAITAMQRPDTNEKHGGDGTFRHMCDGTNDSKCCDFRSIMGIGCCVQCCTCMSGHCFNDCCKTCANTTDTKNPNTCSKGLFGATCNIIACSVCHPCGCFGCCCIDGSWPLAAVKANATQGTDSDTSIIMHTIVLIVVSIIALYVEYKLYTSTSADDTAIKTIKTVSTVPDVPSIPKL